MSLEGSTPLSQNPEGNTAATISDVNDNLNVPQSETKSSPQSIVQNSKTYGFSYEGKIYLNPEITYNDPQFLEGRQPYS